MYGIDCAADARDGALADATARWGVPAFVGRYGPVYPASRAEVAAIHAAGPGILLIWNADQAGIEMQGSRQAGYTAGTRAASWWLTLGAPKGCAVFLDVEAGFRPTPAYLAGWADGARSCGMQGGIYLNPVAWTGQAEAYREARALTDAPLLIFTAQNEMNANANVAVQEWSIGDQPGVATAMAVPGYEEDTLFWQTWENVDGKGVYDLDTLNTADPRSLGVLWHKEPLHVPTDNRRRLRFTRALKPKADHLTRSIHTCFGGDIVTEIGQQTPHWVEVTTAQNITGWLLKEDLEAV